MKIAVTLATACTVASLAMPVAAEAAGQGKKSNIPLQPGQQQVFFRADQLVGKSAQTPFGQKLGELKEIVFNVDQGIYGVVKEDNASYKNKSRKENGERLVALPWSIVTAVTDKAVVFNTSPQELANAPSFTDKQWSKLNDPQFTQQIDSHFKSTEMGGSSGEESSGQSAGAASSSKSSATGSSGQGVGSSTDSTGSSSGSTNSPQGGSSSLDSRGTSSGSGTSTNSASGASSSSSTNPASKGQGSNQ